MHPFPSTLCPIPGNMTIIQIPGSCRAREGRTNSVCSHLQDLTSLNRTTSQMCWDTLVWKQPHTCTDYPGSNLGTQSNPKVSLTVKRGRKPVDSCTRGVSGDNRSAPVKHLQLVLLVFCNRVKLCRVSLALNLGGCSFYPQDLLCRVADFPKVSSTVFDPLAVG